MAKNIKKKKEANCRTILGKKIYRNAKIHDGNLALLERVWFTNPQSFNAKWKAFNEEYKKADPRIKGNYITYSGWEKFFIRHPELRDYLDKLREIKFDPLVENHIIEKIQNGTEKEQMFYTSLWIKQIPRYNKQQQEIKKEINAKVVAYIPEYEFKKVQNGNNTIEQ